MTTDNHNLDGQGGTLLRPPQEVAETGRPTADTSSPANGPGKAAPAAAHSSSGELVDALAVWRAEAGLAPVSIEEVRLDQNERLLIPFTTSMARTSVHYLNFASLRCYVRCNGTGCLLCRVGQKADSRDLLPVYDVISKAVAVLAVSPNFRPQALKPKLFEALTQITKERLLLAIRKIDSYRVSVTALPLPEEADDGAEQIAEFLERLESGSVDLTSIFPRLSNQELAALPEVATLAKARGIKP